MHVLVGKETLQYRLVGMETVEYRLVAMETLEQWPHLTKHSCGDVGCPLCLQNVSFSPPFRAIQLWLGLPILLKR